MLTKEEVIKIKEKLPNGWQKTISQATGYSTVFVSHVINGKRENESIVRAALILIKGNEETKKELSKKIKAI